MSLDSVSAQQQAPIHAPTATVQVIGTRWAVAAGHALAAEAAARVLVAGGNAIDAGVAAGLTLGVVHPDMVSVAGVAPILVHVARTGETFQVSGVGPYPRASTVAYFRERHGGQIPPGLPRTVVPAAPDAWLTALERWGTMSFADVAHAPTERAERGPLASEDLAEFSVEVAPALTTTFGAFEVAACGFWCQGPALLQMLNLLEGVNLAALGHNSPAYLHRIVETVKLAFSDRDAYYGDPRFVKIPVAGLLSKAYAEARSALVGARAWPDMPSAGDPYRLTAERRREAALPVTGGSQPVQAGRGSDELDTSYVAVVDEAGNGFSATPSDPNVDSPVVPGVGCVVSPRGSQGWLDPQHPSVVAPGKRPRLTPAPAMAFTGGRLFMAFGTPGGDVQQQAMLQVFLNVTVFGMEPQAAVEAPRLASRSFPDSFWPHAMAPGKVEIERRIPRETRDALAALGHVVAEWPEFEWRAGAVCVVRVGPDDTRWAGADPRRGSLAIAR